MHCLTFVRKAPPLTLITVEEEHIGHSSGLVVGDLVGGLVVGAFVGGLVGA